MADTKENKPIAVKVSGVKKMYKLGQIGGGSLQADLQSWWARVRGKEDPNTKIGANQRSNGETFMALNGVDLTIYQGEAVGIIGSNGAGKSTLLKLLSRVTAPTEGEIDIYGRIASMLEVGTGFNPEMTGRENVYLNGAILGMTKDEIDAKMEDIIEFSEVREFIDTPVKRYSSGMFVKLAFSVAAHLDSEIMIMDEVLAVGDMAFQTKCLNKMKEAANQEGRTVLYVSHNMNTIKQLCDRCIVLNKGKVIFEGDVNEGISLYLGKSTKDSICKVFVESDHARWCNNLVLLKSAKIMNEKGIIRSGDNLAIEIETYIYSDINDIRMRLVILDQNSEIIGMSMSDNSISRKKGEILRLRINLNTKNLAPDRYSTRISFFNINEYGAHNYVSVVNDFISFTIHDNSKNYHDMNWDIKSWGHINFPSFCIEV